jgi:osmoprotectant transport system ATP-binding protein
MIKLNNVTKRYGNNVAVSGLTMEVLQGELCVLIGPSGCGKTTTLRMINRLVEPTDGMILINGQDNRGSRPEVLRRSIGYAIQSVGLFPHMTVEQNIGTVPSILGWDKSHIIERSRQLLNLVGLDADAYAAKYPHELSGGEAQRIGVARALAADPPILLMDEPFGAVDPLTREMLQRQFMDIQRRLKKTIVLVTHDLDEAIRMADTVAIMRSGRLVQYDTPEVLLSQPVDAFVRDFVGTDRALKRLSRIPVTTLMKPAKTVRYGASRSDAESSSLPRYVWVIDDDDRLLGWADTTAGNDATTWQVDETQTSRVSVADTSSLREALSHMLGQGIRNVPVVTNSGKLVGEVTLRDIEEATAE